jgi:gamma-glutamyltranspeptidase/glutathione hydrolase
MRHFILFGLLIFISCQHKPTASIANPVPNVIHASASEAMMVTAHPLATQAGLEIMKAGGNAIDAAIASHFALAVVYPRAGNLGGGGFLIWRDKEGVSDALDFREKAPALAHEKMYQNEKGDVVHELSLKGPTASGVPGSVAGMYTAFKKYSRLKNWGELLAPAIELAEHGFVLNQTECDRLNQYQSAFKEWNTADESPLIKSSPWKEGDSLIQKELAQTLRQIQEHGPEGFYAGPTAERIIRYMEENEGFIRKEDLQNYQAIWRQPLQVSYKNTRMISMPPPSSGGLALGQLLLAMEILQPDSNGLYHISNAHKVIEAERRVYADRAAYLGDPDFVDVPVARLLDTLYMKEALSTIQFNQASSSASIAPEGSLVLPESFETTHTSIIDPYGNAVAITTTLNSNYGSKVMIPGTGVLMNNEMDDFSAKPGVPNQFGLIGNQANAIAPNKRMLSSMTPTIFEKDGALFLVLGSPGGSTIITSVFQVFMWVHQYDLTVDEAIARGRFHHQWFPDKVMIEGQAVDSLASDLSTMGHHLDTVHYLGYVKGVQRINDTTLIGSGDPRSNDHAEGF